MKWFHFQFPSTRLEHACLCEHLATFFLRSLGSSSLSSTRDISQNPLLVAHISHSITQYGQFTYKRGLETVLETICNTIVCNICNTSATSATSANHLQHVTVQRTPNLRTRLVDLESTRIGLSRHTHCPLSSGHFSPRRPGVRPSLSKGPWLPADNGKPTHIRAPRVGLPCTCYLRWPAQTANESEPSLGHASALPGGSHVRKSQRGVTDEPRQTRAETPRRPSSDAQNAQTS